MGRVGGITHKRGQVCEFNTSDMVDTPPQGPWPSHQRGIWPERDRHHLRVDVEPGMCGRGPPVLCVLVPGDDSQGPLNLWLCLLQSGETALHVAARYGHADVVQLLCSFGSNPNFQDKVGHGS